MVPKPPLFASRNRLFMNSERTNLSLDVPSSLRRLRPFR